MNLDEVAAWKRRELVRAKADRTPADLRAKARNAAPLKDFLVAIRRPDGPSVVAEFRRCSPGADPSAFAGACAEGGARAIGVATDARFLRGSAADLRSARLATDLPVLRRDFVIDEYQLLEARVMLADAALLVGGLLERSRLADCLAMAREDLRMAAPVEVRSERELVAALDAGASSLSIAAPLETVARLRPMVPQGAAVLCETGLIRGGDLVLLRTLGIEAVLTGGQLADAADPAAAIREWLHER